MSKIRRLDDCKSGQDFISLAEKRGAEIRCNGGSHNVVRYGNSSIVVPVHGNEPLGKGLRHVLVKAFTLAGLLIIFVTCILPEFLK